MKNRLGAALAGVPGHAYIFTGPVGIGKNTVARTFAKALLCPQAGPDGACDQCDSCRHFDHQVHPDFRTLMLEEKEKNIKVERVRQRVCADIAMRPQLGSRKVYLIDADFLNEQGQNALLKSLEEPPDYVVFLMTAAGTEKLLPTVLSRSAVIALNRYDHGDLAAILQQQGLTDPQDNAFYVRYANGLPGIALNLAGSPWFADLRKETIRFYLELPTKSRTDLLIDGYKFFDDNRSHTMDILNVLTSLVRDQMIAMQGVAPDLLTNQDERDALTQAWPVLPSDQWNRQKINGPPTRTEVPLSQTGAGHEKEATQILAGCSAALLAARRGLALNASFEGLICQLLLALRKELTNA